MAATLPAFTAVNLGSTQARSSGGPPLGVPVASVALPMSFMVTGLAALLAATIWMAVSPDLLAGYHYNQNIIALTHLYVLGWICSIVMGATYQLVPVALETKLHSETLARWQFVFHSIGFVGMVWSFHCWNIKQVGHFGSVLAFGVGLFVYNIVQTLRRAPKWTVTATAVAAALVWVSLAVLAGLSIALGKCLNDLESTAGSVVSFVPLVHGLQRFASFVARFDPISAMHAHAHLGAVGCFTMLIIGVSYKVIPMFTLSEVRSRRRAGASVLLLNAGLAGSFFAILLRSRWKPAFALLAAAALVLYLWELRAIVQARKRRSLDWGIKYFLTAVALLLPLGLLAVVLSWPGLPLTVLSGQLENLYGFLGLAGVISFAIIGMLYKILPFLVWLKTYSRHVGRAQVPGLAELYSARSQSIGYWTYVFGLATVSAGVVSSSELTIRLGCFLLGLSLATLLSNVCLMLRHFLHPKLKPFATSTASILKTA